VNAVYRQSTRYSCFTEESWASVGLEFGVQWVEVFTATWQSVNHNQKPDVYFINGHVKIWVLQYGVCISRRCVGLGPCGLGWVGLGEEKWNHVHLWPDLTCNKSTSLHLSLVTCVSVTTWLAAELVPHSTTRTGPDQTKSADLSETRADPTHFVSDSGLRQNLVGSV